MNVLLLVLLNGFSISIHFTCDMLPWHTPSPLVLPAKTMSKCFPLLWQPFSQHKHWHGDSRLLVGRFALFTLLARLISLGFHHRANAGSASQLWKWLPWQAPGILSILGWWVHLIYCGPFQKSLFHSPTLSLAVAGPGYEYRAPPISFPIYTWLSSLPLLLSLSLLLFIHLHETRFSLSFSSAHRPSSSLLLHLPPSILFLSIFLQCNHLAFLFLAI